MENRCLRVMLCRAGFSGKRFSCTGRTVIWSTDDCVLCCVVPVLMERDSVVQVGPRYGAQATAFYAVSFLF